MDSRRNNDLPVRKTALPSNANDTRDTRIAANVPQALAYMGVKERNTAEREVCNYSDMFVANVLKEHEYENLNAKLLHAQMSGENRPAFAKMPMATVQLKGIEEGSILHQKAQEAYEKEAKKCAEAFAAAQIGGMIAANAVLIEQLHEANLDFVRNVAKMATALGKDTCVVDPGTHEFDDVTMGGIKMSSDALKNLFVDVAKNGTPHAEAEPRSAQQVHEISSCELIMHQTSALLIGAQYARQGGMLASMKDWQVSQYDTIIQTVKSWNSQKDMPECNVALECLLEKLQQQAATSTPVAALTDAKVDEILRQNSEVFQLTEPLSRMWITDMLKSGRQALDDLQRGKSVDDLLEELKSNKREKMSLIVDEVIEATKFSGSSSLSNAVEKLVDTKLEATSSKKKASLPDNKSDKGGQTVCRFFGTSKGCRNGDDCKFWHNNSSGDKRKLGQTSSKKETGKNETGKKAKKVVKPGFR